MHEEDDDDWRDSFDHFEMEEHTYRDQEHIYNIPKMCKLSSGETIIGMIVNETFEYIELKWPVIVKFQPAKINGEIIQVMLLYRYALGTFNEFVTLNKSQLCWWNDTDEDLDQFYYTTIRKLYQSTEEFFNDQINQQENIEDDQDIENEVYRQTASNKEARSSIQSLISFFTDKKNDKPDETPSLEDA